MNLFCSLVPPAPGHHHSMNVTILSSSYNGRTCYLSVICNWLISLGGLSLKSIDIAVDARILKAERCSPACSHHTVFIYSDRRILDVIITWLLWVENAAANTSVVTVGVGALSPFGIYTQR